ncbi:MAG TPA: 2Fe-2S iron-sulfur cluster-binding protein [Pusillimonas sp.]|uniref:2Fe-2S iron-sulfur cluster-binding protein n=1 Tax=unclassified Pusillimonas TaxID=2640016 RepID=UPI002619F61F|nr:MULTISPECIES: 2Fe-2S iron-sulfur cluster-binding protein [unclassified Pusillimonas]HLU19886.1 2Fe-2S iron-sulfur cluster-binding protein [Pusillimonas sp.]
MAKIRYVDHLGQETELEVKPGTSVMQAAVNNGLAGIVGECGGSAMCATCHVYLNEEDMDKFPPISAPEQEMLECTTSPLKPTSRLGCQLVVAEGMELTVYLPETQQ